MHNGRRPNLKCHLLAAHSIISEQSDLAIMEVKIKEQELIQRNNEDCAATLEKMQGIFPEN